MPVPGGRQSLRSTTTPPLRLRQTISIIAGIIAGSLANPTRPTMPARFDPHLVNEPFADPGLYVDLRFERRALLFDLGDLSSLPPRKLLRISDVFITHRHMDHFAGFDHLLRFLLGRDKVVRLFGLPGLIEAIDAKLRAYTWNLVAGYDGNLVLQAMELQPADRLAVAKFAGRQGFLRVEDNDRRIEGGLLLDEPGLQVRATTLDHGIPVLGFALQERAHINIWRNRLDHLGLAVGPWLRAFKDAVVRGDPEDTPVCVAWTQQTSGPHHLPLGQLKREIMRVTAGRKIAYVVDIAFTPQNIGKVVDLAKGADILFIEGGFLDVDAADAALRRHLTAGQAGTIARLAGVKRLETLHYSPRYQGNGMALAQEAAAAFRRGQGTHEPSAQRLPTTDDAGS
jgi:ribonuclease Z